MKDRAVPFLVGVVVGWWGVRWFIHFGYLAAVIAAYALGHHLALVQT